MFSSPRFYWPVFILLSVVLMLAHLSMGNIPVNLWSALLDIMQRNNTAEQMIIEQIRLPRMILAFTVGVTLGMAGAALQGLLRNPLAGPSLVGVTNCAALGAVIMLYMGWANLAWFVLPAGGMVGALLSVVLIFFLAGRGASILNLILAGVAINAVASSFISLVLNFAKNPYAMNEIVYWLLGSVSNRSINDVLISVPFMLVGCALLLLSRNFLDALSLGEETAQTLGFNIYKQRAWLIVGVALSVGAAVSVSGSIGFIGLVVPHLLRPLVRNEPGKLLAVSAIGGGLLLLLADIAVQVLSVSQELKLGVVTAMVGGPFFLWLIYRMRNEVM